MKYSVILFMVSMLTLGASAQADSISTSMGSMVIHPVQHASMVLVADKKTIYIDPVGGAAAFAAFPKPDLILVTDIHGDHMDPKTIDSIKTDQTMLVVPKAVAEKLGATDSAKVIVLDNGKETEYHGFSITAVPMYNLPETADSRHTKGRGNGYLLNLGGKRVYISGDTEDIPEMRQLKNIDVAFICMNLPYTMDVQQAASAVLEFKPKVVYPYHFRGQGGFSDVNAFKQLVNKGDAKIDVRMRNWYPTK